jgi:hypothetical protein
MGTFMAVILPSLNVPNVQDGHGTPMICRFGCAPFVVLMIHTLMGDLRD